MRETLKYPGWVLFVYLLVGQVCRNNQNAFATVSKLAAFLTLTHLFSLTGFTSNQLRLGCQNGYSRLR